MIWINVIPDNYYSHSVISIMIQFADNCIGAQAFTEMTDEDIDDKELGFSFGGKKILKRVLKILSK